MKFSIDLDPAESTAVMDRQNDYTLHAMRSLGINCHVLSSSVSKAMNSSCRITTTTVFWIHCHEKGKSSNLSSREYQESCMSFCCESSCMDAAGLWSLSPWGRFSRLAKMNFPRIGKFSAKEHVFCLEEKLTQRYFIPICENCNANQFWEFIVHNSEPDTHCALFIIPSLPHHLQNWWQVFRFLSLFSQEFWNPNYLLSEACKPWKLTIRYAKAYRCYCSLALAWCWCTGA